MKMIIPVVGDRVKIKKTINLELKNIAQNAVFLKKYDENFEKVKQIKKNKHNIEIEKGTILTIDRVYIRQGDNAEFNSVTFKIKDDKKLPNGRFFLPVSVVNTLEIDFLGKSEEIKKMTLNSWVFKNKKNRDDCPVKTIESKNNIESVYDFTMKLDLVNLMNFFINKITKEFKSELNMDLKDMYEETINCLKLESKNISKEKREQAISNLEALESHGDLLKNIKTKMLGKNKETLFYFNFCKLNNKNIKSTHLLKVENKGTSDSFFNLHCFIFNTLWMFKYILLEKKDVQYYSFNGEVNKIKDILEEENNIGSRLLSYTWENNYLYGVDEIFIDYAEIKTFNVLNPKTTEFLNEFILFEDQESTKTLQDIRKQLTKTKKL